MLRFILFFALSVSLAYADLPRYISFPNPNDTCTDGLTMVSYSIRYLSNSSSKNISTGCIASYEMPCATVAGLVKCNKRDAICVSSLREYNPVTNPTYYNNMASNFPAEVCVSEGEYIHPDANVLMPAQCVTSFLVIVFVVFMVLYNSSTYLLQRLSGQLGLILYILSFVVCVLQLPSFYYLNGIMGIAAASIAIITFEMGDPKSIAVGMTACIITIMWLTFENGLGYYDQNGVLSSLDALDPSKEQYEVQCKNYYRWSYVVDMQAAGDNTNSAVTISGPCVRNWLAAVHFFSIALKIFLMGLIACGGQVYFDNIRSAVAIYDLNGKKNDAVLV